MMFGVAVRVNTQRIIIKRCFLDSMKCNHNCASLIRQRCYYHELSYETTGDPCQVLRYSQIDEKEEELFLLKRKRMEEETIRNNCFDSHVGVKMLYAPVNPADINAIQGVYPSPFEPTSHTRILPNTHYNNNNISFHHPDFTVCGSEGIGVVTHHHHHTRGNSKQRFKKGDLVALTIPSIGTWRSFLITTESSLTKLNIENINNPGNNDNKQLQNLAPLPQIGGTAYRMLHDFVKELSSEDVVIQNGGASSVGIMVSQLASILFGAKVVSIVRRGPDRTDDQWNQLCQYLTNQGKCAYVFQEERLLHNDTKKQAMKELQQVLYELSTNNSKDEKKLPRLGLNCIGGPSATIVARCLSHHGTMVTYGGMSKQGVVIPTGMMIFKNLKFVGYWHSRWNIQADVTTKQTMIDKLFNLANDQLIHCPSTHSMPLRDYNRGLQYAIHGKNITEDNDTKEYVRKKLVFDCRE